MRPYLRMPGFFFLVLLFTIALNVCLYYMPKVLGIVLTDDQLLRPVIDISVLLSRFIVCLKYSAVVGVITLIIGWILLRPIDTAPKRHQVIEIVLLITLGSMIVFAVTSLFNSKAFEMVTAIFKIGCLVAIGLLVLYALMQALIWLWQNDYRWVAGVLAAIMLIIGIAVWHALTSDSAGFIPEPAPQAQEQPKKIDLNKEPSKDKTKEEKPAEKPKDDLPKVQEIIPGTPEADRFLNGGTASVPKVIIPTWDEDLQK